MTTAWVICNQELQVSGENLPTSQLTGIMWFDYLRVTTSQVHWVGSLWFGQFFQTEAACDAMIVNLVALGISGSKVAVTIF